MVFNKTFSRTTTALSNNDDFDEIQQNKIFADLGAIQTDINNIETETDSLDSSISTINTKISNAQVDLDWTGLTPHYVTISSILDSSWKTGLSISGEGWVSFIMGYGSFGTIQSAINVDGIDITTTSNPYTPPSPNGFSGLFFHFDSSCDIKLKSTFSTKTAKILYWV